MVKALHNRVSPVTLRLGGFIVPTIAWAAIAAALFLVVLWKMASPSIDRIVDGAIGAKSIAGVVEAISKHRPNAQPNLYNHAIRRLWNTYERELAAELIKEFAKNHHTENIAQYWLKQVAQAEPNLATTILTKPFFDSYFLPEVANRCGPVG
jgi:hypothetical protein